MNIFSTLGIGIGIVAVILLAATIVGHLYATGDDQGVKKKTIP